MEGLSFADGAMALHTFVGRGKSHAVARLWIGMALRAFHVEANVLLVVEGNRLFGGRLGGYGGAVFVEVS